MAPEPLRRFLTDLYRRSRAARMNRLYYGWKLERTKRWSRAFEYSIAAFGSGSALAGWRLWTGQTGAEHSGPA